MQQSKDLPPTNNPLESLLRNLRLRRRNYRVRIRITEPTPCLAILLARRLGTAHPVACRCYLRAARRATVSVRHATSRDELRSVAKSDVARAGLVGRNLGEREGCED